VTKENQMKMKRWLAASVVAGCAVGVSPAVAGAADYCVAPNTSCASGNLGSLELALDFADQLPDADRIFLGAHTYIAPAAGFSYDKPEWPVEIVGKGTGKTILTGSPGGSRVLKLEAAPGSSVHDLTIRTPENATLYAKGLVTRNVARRIEVVDNPTQVHAAREGVELHHGGALEDSTVSLAGGGTVAVGLHPGETAVRRSALRARTAVYNHSSIDATVEHSWLTGSVGVRSYTGVLELSGSVIRFEQAGIAAYSTGGPTTVKADDVTLAGAGFDGARGVYSATTGDPGKDVAVTLANSIIRGTPTALKAEAPGSGQATLAVSHSDYDGTKIKSGPGASISETDVSHVGDAGFVDAASGDYRLRAGSPLVDAGDPAAGQGLDIDGNPLIADGNGDGVARRDLGAFELQPAPAGGGQPDPTPPGGTEPGGTSSGGTSSGGGEPTGSTTTDTQAPVIGAFRSTRHGTRFRYTLSEPARVTLEIRRARGRRTLARLTRMGASGPNRLRIGKRTLRPGRYRAVLTATDAAGNRSARRAIRFRIVRG
jgi:hypothetical protein